MKEFVEKNIVCVMGPTASGKTDLAVQLAQQLSGSVISVDSAMVYRGMDIGTAKPTPSELKTTPHRLIDLCDPTEVYSAGRFCEDALLAIQEIHAQGRLPILVGGTMLYFNKLFYGMAQLPTADPKIRHDLSEKAEKIGWAAMHDELAAIDPVAASRIKPQDPQRISRALEVFALTGKPISLFHQDEHASYLADYQVTKIALVPQDRTWLHDRIAKRFDAMLAAGFLEEAKQFFDDPRMTPDLPAMRMVGYRQAWEYFAGRIDFDTMRAQAVAATRQLAKRQLTWLRSWEGLTYLDPQQDDVLLHVLRMCKV